MEFDIKNNLLKTSVGENRLGQKSIKAAIDDSLVTQMAQKGLDMNLEKEASFQRKNKEDEEKKKNRMNASSSKNASQSQEQLKDEKKIERDPMKLLKLL